jgi:CBS domain
MSASCLTPNQYIPALSPPARACVPPSMCRSSLQCSGPTQLAQPPARSVHAPVQQDISTLTVRDSVTAPPLTRIPLLTHSPRACMQDFSTLTVPNMMSALPLTHSLTLRARMQDISTLTVRDMMTAPPLTLKPETSVTEAMEFIVKHRVSGVPVVDGLDKVIGVCSGYDLLALDSTPGTLAFGALRSL